MTDPTPTPDRLAVIARIDGLPDELAATGWRPVRSGESVPIGEIGIDVTEWDDFWLGLLREYVRESNDAAGRMTRELEGQ
jgi:hypothetical protein